MDNEGMISNEEKRQVYAILKTKLKIAMDQEFYLEALLLEYSIVEDRLLSILKHLGLKYHGMVTYTRNIKEYFLQGSWIEVRCLGRSGIPGVLRRRH